MKRHEKLKRCIKCLIKQNLEDLKNFDLTKIIEENDNSTDENKTAKKKIKTSVDDSSLIDGNDLVEVTLEDLFVKITSDWNIKSRGRKKENKGRPKSSK